MRISVSLLIETFTKNKSYCSASVMRSTISASYSRRNRRCPCFFPLLLCLSYHSHLFSKEDKRRQRGIADAPPPLLLSENRHALYYDRHHPHGGRRERPAFTQTKTTPKTLEEWLVRSGARQRQQGDPYDFARRWRCQGCVSERNVLYQGVSRQRCLLSALKKLNKKGGARFQPPFSVLLLSPLCRGVSSRYLTSSSR